MARTRPANAGGGRAKRLALARLPEYVEPMLAQAGRPFDSPRFLFEVKWDGTRALAFIDGGGEYRLLNRRRRDIAWRYPDLAFLGGLPPGTLLDGEVVCLGPDGRPDFHALQSREQVRTTVAAQRAVAVRPAVYVVFDLLYLGFKSVMDQQCAERRARLRGLVAGAGHPRLVLSEGVVGDGVAYFERAAAQGLEGVVAKRLDSTYQPGKRTGAWVKVKRHEVVCCVVIGFVPEGDNDFASLVIAARGEAGALRCVGRVGTGFDARLRARINDYLWSHLRQKPVIVCREKGRWVEPALYCTVRCMERTADGHLRAPAFLEVRDAPQTA
jgi:bifunctional non-homologous end joining protein LigD